MSESPRRYVVWFEELDRASVQEVGGKSASLGEMMRLLAGGDVTVPPGFAVTTGAFTRTLDASPGVRQLLIDAIEGIDYDNFESLFRSASRCRDLVLDLEIPSDVEDQIASAYERLEERANMQHVDVAVRSSAVSEDGKEASFAGQYESFLGIRGRRNLLTACLDCFASMFTSRGVDYRHRCGLPADTFDFAVTVQRMVRSDRASSGVLFTLDPETGARDVILLNASWGLGEPIVQGQVRPDEVLLFKPTLRRGGDLDPIIASERGAKEVKMVYSWGGTAETEVLETTPEEQATFSIERQEAIRLARAAIQLEDAYGLPIDIEWAKDGINGELYMVQARPITVHHDAGRRQLERYRLLEESPVLVTGQSVGSRVGAARARVIHDIHGIDDFHDGEVLVTERTDPDWEPVMKRAAAIVTDSGGRTSHAAIVAREIGVPCVVGTGDGTEKIATGTEVTVSCIHEQGLVHEGLLRFERELIDLEKIPETRTDVMLIVGNPSQALAQSRLPNRGVGLARLEFIIASQIGIHPRALLEPDALDQREREQMAEAIAGYDSGPEFFHDRLAHGVAMIGAAFHPHDVIVRLTDLKSNEYRGLLGGRHFEPIEENPMLGWRGACRYATAEYLEAFRMECEALRHAREQMGLDNIKVMVPFARTVPELEATLAIMQRFGLRRGDAGLEVYLMVEIPSNVMMLREFAAHVDGLSIGSNDLTQLTLGLDRDAGGRVASIGDERDPGVQAMFRMILATVRELKSEGRCIRLGICGQAPSDFPEITRLLVQGGIDSISVTPDVAVATALTVAAAEAEMAPAATA